MWQFWCIDHVLISSFRNFRLWVCDGLDLGVSLVSLGRTDSPVNNSMFPIAWVPRYSCVFRIPALSLLNQFSGSYSSFKFCCFSANSLLLFDIKRQFYPIGVCGNYKLCGDTIIIYSPSDTLNNMVWAEGFSLMKGTVLKFFFLWPCFRLHWRMVCIEWSSY